ncbi:hypothetical protein pdam_00013366 [Pocillopora damicornis]|uniref:Tetratricopeptide repeat protein 37 n=1 Tax=Pocillopora damicornis TaxID=46731 RepID=A0A3M6TMS4_POCDA|nr:hypothetical protein pdam_00013366 [Pocillopora damicornis]
MAAKEIKSTLKNARECIKNKDYKEAFKHCKVVLKADKTNYNALVFFGKCASELGQLDQAHAAYRKAIESDDTQPLAWQGLAALCEKEENPQYKAELPGVYEKLLLMYESENTKWLEIASKLAEAVHMWEKMAMVTKDAAEQFGIWMKIIKILEKEAYEKVLHSGQPQEATKDLEIHFENYLRLLINNQVSEENELYNEQRQKIFNEAQSMIKLFPASVVALEILTKAFLQSLTSSPTQEMTITIQRLYHIHPGSEIGMVGLGSVLFHKKDFVMARTLLQKGLQSFTNCPYGWLTLCQLQIRLHDYQKAEKSAKEGLECINSSIPDSRKELKTILSMAMAEALLKQGPSTAALASKIYEKLLTDGGSEEEVQLLTGLGQAHLTLGDIQQATQICAKALTIDKSCPSALALQGQISFHEGYFDDAELRFLEAIEKCEDCAFYHFLLGKLYWEMNGNLRADKKKCLAEFLKAAKLDSYYSPTFLYLGHYYHGVLKDLSKASRCYQKAFDLDPSSVVAGIALGDSLMEVGNEAAALNLYKNVTSASSPGEGKWAWLRLGLFHLKQNESTVAISCFQSALRADLKDRHCWECLGEAYMSRGSYIAAMKAFTKASETLKISGNDDPCARLVRGLGETYLNQARSALQQDFNGKAVDCVMAAIHVLARAVQCKPGLSCLWKLIGDCCTIIHPVSNISIRGTIPDNLKKHIHGEHNDLDKKQLLALGSGAYGRALKLQPDCGSLSLQALKKGLTLQPSNHKLWNSLGVVAASREVNNPDLSQHSFIMSIKTEPNNVIAWTNLGVLYLKHGKIEATIAEIIGNEEAMDLFRHTTELGSHVRKPLKRFCLVNDIFSFQVEGSIGYSHWVCSSLISEKSRDSHVILKGKPAATLSHLHPEYRKAVLQSATALSKYTDRVRDNAGAYNMYGLLLEHQKLFLQAEKAFKSAIDLLRERATDDDQQHLNTVLVNYARVLCAMGRYKDAVETYQAVKPLTAFHDLCGLALSLFMAGQLKESYQAYEQAFQLAATDADRSCILTAMGMLGYALDDKDGAKAMLFKSSQLQPACDRGLMALCAFGLVSGDATLAGAALGTDELTGDICYLYSRFYALQGNQKLGRSHIMKEIHRLNHLCLLFHSNPRSSLLWSQLASYLLQACPDELQAAARCSESSATLGGSHSAEHNPAFQPAGIVGSGSLRHDNGKVNLMGATHRTHAGLRASQKAVHAHPDHSSSWAVLAASVTAHDIAKSREELGRDKSTLGARLSQFVESTAHGQVGALKSLSDHQLPALVKLRTSHLETLQSWAIIHHGYCLLHAGRQQEAAELVDKALFVYSSVPQISAQLHFLKAQVLLASGETVETGLNMLQTSLLSSPTHSSNAWQVLAQVQADQGASMAAELCYRKCLQAGMDNRAQSWRTVPLIRLALLAVQMVQKSQTADRDRWMDLSLEASNEVLKLNSSISAAYHIQGIVHFLQDNARASRRAFQHVLDSDTASGSSIAQYWLLSIYLKKKDLSAAQFHGNKRLDLIYYRLAEEGDLPKAAKKRLIERCVHVNPSKQIFWSSLKEYS